MRKMVSRTVIYGGVGIGSFVGITAAEQIISDKVFGDFDASSWQGGASTLIVLVITFFARKTLKRRKKA